ncbi:ATPase subunit of ABC transporter with duplicated ATPase domains [Pseudonocardia hierapolitana]|uniref:ATPase subunit of ABC transporter with duplicated ATPase domains n=1 Tax=Pseudonocardia hierapolitana TaxID=1128676 RepID=A0A561SU82_9PSEU|nr:ABC-F family ATP-binding cassette domain-containing protein [Pseudonocardia hierapolitana]TWF78419.1 ATPase subunit of ABC transporter with duplicated ATPase domains [Pseudonocardia hierapolitana]
MSTPAVVCSGLSFSWPDGTPVLRDLDVAFGAGRTGIVGLNGSGKSTLLRLVAGRLAPTAGSISTAGDVGHLPQDVALDTGRTVAELLGIAGQRAALHAVEAGDATAIAAVGDGWDVEERAVAELARLGLPTDLDRRVGTLSGGEVVLTGLAGLLVRRPAVALLDEPTNNLDRRARELLYAAVSAWPGVLLVVSHDRELLELVDAIAELRGGSVRMFGGTLSEYEAQLAAEQEAARRIVRVAEADLRRERRQLVEARIKLARRVRYANTDHANKRKPKIVMNQRRTEAQVSAGKHRIMHEQRLAGARRELRTAESAVRDDDRIRVDLPRTAVPAGRTVLEVGGLVVRGPERIGLLGANGSGKTTLLRSLVPAVPHAYLPQRLDVLDDAGSVLDNVRTAAPSLAPQDVRAGLARFRVHGDAVDQRAGTLSGGERFRVVLAMLLLAEPPPQLLLLDEPTNNLDLDSVERLTEALAAFRGTIIVASHDVPFLRRVGCSRWWSVDDGLQELVHPGRR